MLTNLDYSAGAQHDGKIGIIDIGSNSIRLVVYDGLRRAPLPIFNEKIICGLGRGLARTGTLHPEGVKLAEAGVARFLAIARLMDVVELNILATAAVRDASDGDAFVDRLSRKYRVDIEVISGKREAKLAAFGVFSSVHGARGIAADLGGGSMELVALEDGAILQQDTLPLGALRVMDEGENAPQKMAKLIDKTLDGESWLKKTSVPALYAIGGSFRALAKMHMAARDYPLNIIHHYTVPAKDMLELARQVSRLTPAEIGALPGGSGKRAGLLIPAALTLEQLIERTRCAAVVFSSSGIREGYLYERLSPFIRKEDPLIASAADLAAQTGRLSGYARELYEWMTPLFPKEPPALARLRLAACILSEIGIRMHPEYRGEWVYYRVIESLLFGLDHEERVMLALALFHRHQFKPKETLKGLGLITPQQRAWTKLIGTAANLAYHLCGGVAGNIARMPLTLEKKTIALTLKGDTQEVMGDAVKKRIDGLGETFKAWVSSSK